MGYRGHEPLPAAGTAAVAQVSSIDTKCSGLGAAAATGRAPQPRPAVLLD